MDCSCPIFFQLNRAPARLRVLAADDFIVAKVGRVVLEAGTGRAELRRRVCALGRRGHVGVRGGGGEPHEAAPSLATPLAAVLLRFGCGRTGAIVFIGGGLQIVKE